MSTKNAPALNIPPLDINKIIRLVYEVKYEGKAVKDAAIEIAVPYKDYAVKLGKQKAETVIAEQLDKMHLEKLSGKKFSKDLVKCSEAVGKLVWRYMHKEISREQLINGLQKTQLKDLCMQFISALGIEEMLRNELTRIVTSVNLQIPSSGIINFSQADLSRLDLKSLEDLGIGLDIQALAEQLLQGIDVAKLDQLDPRILGALFPWMLPLALSIISYAASMAAYKELKKAFDQLEAAHERRLEVEAACAESVAMIREYRAEMNEVAARYLTERLTAFESGFREMDQAILDGDSDGYIRGSVEIQQALGYDVQFTTQEEFDDLMESDLAFKL